MANKSPLFYKLLGLVTTMGVKDPKGPDYSLFLFNRKVLPVSPYYVQHEMEFFCLVIGN